MNCQQLPAMIEEYLQQGKDIRALRDDYVALATSGKTPLGLNQWVKSDKPLMEDFNEDNRIIDENLRELRAKSAVAEETPDEIPLSLNAGVTQRTARCSYTKNAQGLVQVHFSISAEPYKDTMQMQLVTTLPAGYRPKTMIISSCVGHNAAANATSPGIIHVDTSGNLRVQFLGAKMSAAFGEVSFYAV